MAFPLFSSYISLKRPSYCDGFALEDGVAEIFYRGVPTYFIYFYDVFLALKSAYCIIESTTAKI